MADKRLIDNSSSTTVDNFYGNKSGADVQIPLAEAASVLAASVGSLYPRGDFNGNIDTIINNGVYYCYDVTSEKAIPLSQFIMVTFAPTSTQYFKLQFAANVEQDKGRELYYRIKRSDWSEWKQISTL